MQITQQEAAEISRHGWLTAAAPPFGCHNLSVPSSVPPLRSYPHTPRPAMHRNYAVALY